MATASHHSDAVPTMSVVVRLCACAPLAVNGGTVGLSSGSILRCHDFTVMSVFAPDAQKNLVIVRNIRVLIGRRNGRHSAHAAPRVAATRRQRLISFAVLSDSEYDIVSVGTNMRIPL